MKNTKTNPCLPVAPRRGISSILRSAYCTMRHSAFLIVAMAVMMVGTALAAAPTITAIYSSGTHKYGVGDNIDFKVEINNGNPEVLTVSGSPKLVLSGIQPGGTAEAGYVGVIHDSGDDVYYIQFRYTVKAGDFSAGLGVSQFNLSGATITADGDTMTTASSALPAANKILNNETITIETITFADGSRTMAAGQVNTGGTLEVEIKRGGTTAADQEFTISVSPENQAGKINVPTFKIPANSSSATCQIDLTSASDPITVTFHPANYTDATGDLTLTLTVMQADAPHIVAVHNEGDNKTYSVGERIDISVEFNDVISLVNGSPYLSLDIFNQDKSPKVADLVEWDDKFMYFTYIVQPGDFAKDLDLISYGFILNGASIYINGTADANKVGRAGYRAVPVGANTDNSLSRNADINITTITLDDYSLARSLSGNEGERFSVEITRSETSTKEQRFSITPSIANAVDFPANFSIPRDAESAIFDIDLVEATPAGTPLKLTLHPSGYDKAINNQSVPVTDGDIVLTITINTGTKPPILISGPAQLEEGTGIAEYTVSLSRTPRDTVSVTVQSSDAAKLKILSGSSLTFAAGDNTARTVTVQPLDGNEQITLTASTTNPSFSQGTLSVFVANKNPILINPPAEGWEPAKGGEGFAYTIGWSGNDVAADTEGLYVYITWGDGTPRERYNGGSGSASHVYNVPGSFGITVELHDKDGGVAMASGTVEIEPAVSILINEYKIFPFPDDVGQNAYKGLQGLGRGSVDDDLNETTRRMITSKIDWQIKYSPATATANLIASPETFTYEGVDYEGNADEYQYDSFFHVWLGDEETFRSQWCLVPLSAPRTAAIRLRDGGDAEDRQVGAVFAREHYPQDNYADIDWDRLPDRWENQYLSTLVDDGGLGGDEATYPFESIAGIFGENGNPDNDFLPACVTGIDAVTGEFTINGTDFSPTGIAFINLYEVRGTHPGLNAKNSEQVEPQDEPHKGSYNLDAFTAGDGESFFTDNDTREFFGTDPTKPDTDEDKLTDGYEYFFWRWAKFAEKPVGEKYDPKKVVVGTPISNEVVIAYFNPCVPNDHLTLDLDGDGLTDFEEFLLGTNPIHWDTDGDGMNDGWEIMWGLNPKDPKDATLNPDGDMMANDAHGRYHADVYVHYGFDPRTGWGPTYLERNRILALPAPNTAPFSNYHEHYLGRWCIDHNFAAEVEPMSMMYMTQPVPSGTPRFYNPAWKGTPRKVPNYAVNPSEGGGVDVADDTVASVGGGYTVPFGDLSYIVDQIEITDHGCDSDGDGMPDGWELYQCSSDGTSRDGLWPISPNKSTAQDAVLDSDGDLLNARGEFRSVETCDYYSSICTNGAFAFSGNWYNKWWPTDIFNADTDGDHLPDGYEGDATFRYQESFEYGTHGTSAGAWIAAHPCTDGSQLTFGDTTMLRGHVPGGGLNPCCIDTDMDYIPDHWEYLYAGHNRDTAWAGGFCNTPGTETGLTIQNGQAFIVLNGAGMDGTYFDSRSGYDECSHAEDRNFDYDGDGLENYQEYWINGVRHFQYDKWVAGGDYGDYDPQAIFDTGLFQSLKDQPVSFVEWPQTKPLDYGYRIVNELFMKWDWSTYANDWQNAGGENPADDSHVMSAPSPFHYMPSEIRPKPLGAYLYASTDPRLADSDGDGMDDYYEMFHGLNPILSDVIDYCMQEHPVGETYDFRKYPWMAGMPNADPDGDDIPNWEEALSPDQPAPANHNTDPSPLWMTDMSYDHSFVNLYYNWGSAANYWTVENDQYPPYEYYPFPGSMFPGLVDPRAHYVFDFECNEGFDTDNDNLSDPYEINGSAGGVTDPQNPDRPIGRKALYLDGDAAARTRSICAFGPNALRSFTLEVWVMPEEPASGKMQVILERPVTWDESNTSPTYENIRRNFRLGLLGDGRPFVEFDNGGKNLITERATADAGNVLEAGKWCHLAATMDGFSGKLSLYMNGRRISVKSTTQIPYTGFTTTALNAVGSDEYHQPRWSPVVIGASDANPVGQVDGSYEYYNGAIGEIQGGQPQLGDFFKGWVDEIRIWDGARPGGEDIGDQRTVFWHWPTIKDDYDNLKRYGMDEVRAARNDVVKYLNRIVDYRKSTVDANNAAATAALNGSNPVNASDTNNVDSANTTYFFDGRGMTFDEFIQQTVTYIMMTGGEDVKCRIPPSLLCVYNFDTLPDPDYEPVQPAKFASLNGRPMDYNGVPWLRGAVDRSTVYTSTEAPYLFPQYIQNLVSWQPLGHLAAAGMDEEYGQIREDANMPLFKYQPDSVVNSKYWTRYTKGGQNLSDLEAYSAWDTVNTFPNSANPYGYRYETGIIVNEENHPLTTAQEAYDPSYAALFNDLVPLRNARADMSVQLWDDPAGDKLGVNKDTDGDSIPDWWELANGMDPYNADQNGNGVRDDVDDFDGDGLGNWYEYLAGKLNPFLPDTDADGVTDFNASPDGKLSYGWLYTDGDYVLDSYELQWDDNFASPYRYDEHEDRDVDGWDNWSEGLVGTALAYGTYDVVSTNDLSALDASDKAAAFPLPNLKVTLDYNGAAVSGAKLVIHAYSHEDMNGWPDAIFVKDIPQTVDVWPVTMTVGPEELVYGHILQGKNWFFAWLEAAESSSAGGSGSGQGGNEGVAGFGDMPTWNNPEPAAIADNQLDGIDIGFDLNEVTFHFTDKAESFARFSWDGAMPAGDDVHVAILSGGNKVFDRVIQWPRTWLHEGDIISWNQENSGKSRKDFGLGAQEGSLSANNGVVRVFQAVLTPQRDYEAEQWSTTPFCEISNWVHTASALAKPVLYGPIGRDIVAAARPEFKFSLDPEFTEFRFRLVTRVDETGEWVAANQKTLYDERVLAPGRFKNDATHERDLVIFKSPLAVGDTWTNGITFEAGKTYQWAVNAFSPGVKSGTATAVQNFTTASLASADDSHYAAGGKGVIDVKVSYPSGMAYAATAKPSIRVQAFRSKSFNGDPDASLLVSAPADASMGNFSPVEVRLYGLELGIDYYVRAYIEQGGDPLARDKWESWGYYRSSDDADNPFMPVAAQAQRSDNVGTPYEITIGDCDTDNDLLPDAWEWTKVGNFSQGVEQARFNVGRTVAYGKSPLEILAAAPQTFCDYDGDGISDYDELYTGSDPTMTDTDGDGIADGLERTLGFNAATPQSLKITSVAFDANGNPVLDWTWDGAASPTKGRTLLKMGRELAYEVQAKISLTDPEWITIRTVYTDEIDGQAVVTEEGAPAGVDVSAFRFFRVKLGAE